MSKTIVIGIWALAATVVILLITLPISLQAQLVAGYVVARRDDHPQAPARPRASGGCIALAFGTAIVLRYVYWRTTSTLPPINQLENFIPGLLLYLAELYSVGMLALSLFVVATPLPPRARRRRSWRTAADRRRLRPDLQRGRVAPRHDARGGARRWTTRPTSSPSGCSTTAAPTRSAIDANARRGCGGAASAAPTLQRALRATRRQLPDARARTSTPRPATSTTASTMSQGELDRRLRRRPRARRAAS